MRHWREEGLTISAIASLAHLDRKTIRKYLNTDHCPDWRVPRARVSKLAPYETYLLEHADGQRTVRQLGPDIQAQGFTGSLSTVPAFLAKDQPSATPADRTPSVATQPDPTPCHLAVARTLGRLNR